MTKIINLSSKTKEEVILNFINFWDSTDRNKSSTQFERISERMSAIKTHELNFNNFKASFRPAWQITGPVQPTYTDDRMRKYRGRFGHTRSD